MDMSKEELIALKRLQGGLDTMILATETGEARDLLTEENIALLRVIYEAGEGTHKYLIQYKTPDAQDEAHFDKHNVKVRDFTDKELEDFCEDLDLTNVTVLQ